MTYRERRTARAERLRDWASKRATRATGNFSRAWNLIKDIPPGQPILIGHHSERRHRRTLDRHDAAMSRGLDDQRMASSMASRADNIDAAAERAIYRDDVDAIERLEAKIADLEAQRDRIKAVNAGIRKYGLDAFVQSAGEQYRAELADLAVTMRVAPYQIPARGGFPAYALSNLAGNINRQRQRLAELQAARTPSGAPIAAPAAGTPIERAGLTVTAGMTTPTRPGKQPRPVWTVTGNLAFWRPLLVDVLGGTWYRGAVSFWDDPTPAIDAAVRDAIERDNARGVALEVQP